ncbi:hypothetical protein V3481_009061 [Fusarium oxysporum f. sp. vasinfectum]
MFKLARLSAVNEHSGRNSAVSMKVLVEVASTDWGSFSPLKFWTFVRSRRPRVICLGMIAVFSALSFSLLGNVVAYQQAGVDTSTQVLEYLHDTHSVLPGGSRPIPLDDQSIRQQVSARLQDRFLLLQQGMLESSTEGLVSVNVSDQSRSSLSPAVMQLFHAPVYRLKMFCSPSHPQGVSVMVPDKRNPHIRSTGWADIKVNGSDWSMIENTLVDEKRDTGYDVPVLSLTSSLNVFDDGRDGRPPGLGGYLLRAVLGDATEGSRQSWDLETLADAFL